MDEIGVEAGMGTPGFFFLRGDMSNSQGYKADYSGF